MAQVDVDIQVVETRAVQGDTFILKYFSFGGYYYLIDCFIESLTAKFQDLLFSKGFSAKYISDEICRFLLNAPPLLVEFLFA